MTTPDPFAGDKRHAPATLRNRDAIAAVLAEVLPSSGTVLEIASGSGEHACFFAERFAALTWQPSDCEADALRSIEAWRAEAALPNLLEAVPLDVETLPWPVKAADAMLCINMLHISPWSAAEALFIGAAEVLPEDAPLVLYGPYRRADRPTAPSNEAFDQSLRARDPRWGLRSVEAVDALAASYGLERSALVEMPANNLTLVYRLAPVQDHRPMA